MACLDAVGSRGRGLFSPYHQWAAFKAGAKGIRGGNGFMNAQLSIARGTLIVFEGLDKAGKSTQVTALKAIPWAGVGPNFVHMPSGLTEATQRIYGALEEGGLTSALAKQLFHLACHAENVPTIESLRPNGAVILDRFWWSTIAYGWYAGHLEEVGLDEPSFLNLISTIWAKLPADLVFLFLDPREEDDNNTDDVNAGYIALARQFPEKTVLVPELSVAETTEFILEKLEASGLVSRAHADLSGDVHSVA